MATYQVTIDEKMTLGKNIVALLQSIPQAVTLGKPQKKEPQKKRTVPQARPCICRCAIDDRR